jgi:predicted Zn-dependent protease
MRQLVLLAVGIILSTTGCSETPKTPAITLVNAGAVEADVLERVRAFAEKELHVCIRAEEDSRLASKTDVKTLEQAAVGRKTDADVTLVVLSDCEEAPHLVVNSEKGVALINVRELKTDDAEVYARRIERQVMRAAAFAFGMPPTPDPYCVTRHYRSLEDLDSMGRNYSPPWMGRFAEEAAKRGLEPLPVGNPNGHFPAPSQ